MYPTQFQQSSAKLPHCMYYIFYMYRLLHNLKNTQEKGLAGQRVGRKKILKLWTSWLGMACLRNHFFDGFPTMMVIHCYQTFFWWWWWLCWWSRWSRKQMPITQFFCVILFGTHNSNTMLAAIAAYILHCGNFVCRCGVVLWVKNGKRMKADNIKAVI